MRLRLACVVDEPIPSKETSTVQVVHTLAALSRAGAEVDLFVPAATPLKNPRAILEKRYGIECPFRVIQTPMWASAPRWVQKPMQAALTNRAATNARYDVLYARVPLPAIGALLRAAPVVFETYRPLPDQFPWTAGVFRLAARHPSLLSIVTHSDHARRSFLNAGVRPEKIHRVYNGYEASDFRHTFTPPQARAKLGLVERPTLVYAGRLSTRVKRCDMLLDAAAALPEIELVLVGSTETREGRQIAARAESMPNVTMLGYRVGQELATALQAADVLAIPPSLKPLQVGTTVLPIKVFQYLAAGRPIVCGDTQDTREILVHDQCAVRVVPDQPSALIEALRALFADSTRMQRLAARAAERAADLSWDHRAARLIDIFGGSAATAPGRRASATDAAPAWRPGR